MAADTQTQTLIDTQRASILSLKQLELGRLNAIAAGDPASAETYRKQIIALAQLYNTTIGQLQALQSDAGWQQLAHLDDLTIPGASGAVYDIVNGTGQATTSPGDRFAAGVAVVTQSIKNGAQALGDAVGGVLGTVKILPYLAVGVVLVALIYVYTKAKR